MRPSSPVAAARIDRPVGMPGKVLQPLCCGAVKGTVAIVVVPSLNVTAPVGVATGLLTVAVKVTFCPATQGLAEEPNVAVVGGVRLNLATNASLLPGSLAWLV